MEPDQFLEAYPASSFRLIGHITPMFGGFSIRAEIVALGETSGVELGFIPPGPFDTEEDAKSDTTIFATSSGYDLSWVGPATWQ